MVNLIVLQIQCQKRGIENSRKAQSRPMFAEQSVRRSCGHPLQLHFQYLRIEYVLWSTGFNGRLAVLKVLRLTTN